MRNVWVKFASVALALLVIQAQTVANCVSTIRRTAETDVARFDESEIYNSFNDVSDLIAFIQENENLTHDELLATNNHLIRNVSPCAAIMVSAKEGTPPLMGAFWWGCIFSVVGVLIVCITTDNNHEYMKPAWRGCGYNLIIVDLAIGIPLFWTVVTEGL